uniref:Uncharacterized protein n=1 Tax=Cannabis sativa TaxID=3483 RepID=A0A803Q9A1_CANSA
MGPNVKLVGKDSTTKEDKNKSMDDRMVQKYVYREHNKGDNGSKGVCPINKLMLINPHWQLMVQLESLYLLAKDWCRGTAVVVNCPMQEDHDSKLENTERGFWWSADYYAHLERYNPIFHERIALSSRGYPITEAEDSCAAILFERLSLRKCLGGPMPDVLLRLLELLSREDFERALKLFWWVRTIWVAWAVGVVGDFAVPVAKLLSVRLRLELAIRFGFQLLRVDCDLTVVVNWINNRSGSVVYQSLIF